MATAHNPRWGGALCRSCRMVVGAIVSRGVFAGDFSTHGEHPRASVYVRVVFAQIRAREYPRETGRDNICQDLHACPTNRPLFSYRNAASCPLSARPCVREKWHIRTRASLFCARGPGCYAPCAGIAPVLSELERLRACHTRYYPLRKFPLRDMRSTFILSFDVFYLFFLSSRSM